MRTHSTPRHGHPASVRLAVVIAAIVGLVAACTGAVGVAGPVPTPPATPVGSVLPGDGASTEPTAPASASPATAAASASPGTSPAASIRPTAAPIASPVATTTVRVYFFQPDPAGGDAHLVPVLRTVPATRAVATAAVRELLAGPASDERGLLTMIPAGSQLLGITIDGSVATVDLTGAFESGGGSASMFGRLAQLIYTLTQFPTVDTVRLRLAGPRDRPGERVRGTVPAPGAGRPPPRAGGHTGPRDVRDRLLGHVRRDRPV